MRCTPPRLERWLGSLLASSAWLLGASPATAADQPALSALEVTTAVRATHRTFGYHDTPAQLYPARGYNTLLSYEQPLAPSVFARVDLFPFAFSSRGPAANFGLSASYEEALGTTAVFGEGTPQKKTLDSQSSELFLGLRGRLPLAAHELGLTAGYGEHQYGLVGDAGKPLVPDVDYTFVRLSADASFRFDKLSLGLHLGARLVQDTGGLQREWFPTTKTQAFEGGLLLGYRVLPYVEVVAGVDLTRYAFDFNPIPPDADPTYVAGGAVDQYVSGWLGARFSLASHAAR